MGQKKVIFIFGILKKRKVGLLEKIIPHYFNEEWYVEKKKTTPRDVEIAQSMGVSVQTMYKWKKKMGIKKMRIYSELSVPAHCTKEWYDKQKEMGKTDVEIARDELFVSISTFNRWKKKGVIQSTNKQKSKGYYSEYAVIANGNGISYHNMMQRIYNGWNPMVAATKEIGDK